jgi:O-antigen/teichoic acid export membrane protein
LRNTAQETFVSLKKNLTANYLGKGWVGLMGFAFIPLYIQYLGIESYGLIGIFAILNAWLALLDMGMAPTLNREMARYTAGAHTPQSICDLLRSLEIIGFALACAIGLLIWMVSGWLANDWLRVERLQVEAVSQAIAIMGAVGILGFLEGLYRGTILGLQRQVLFNAISALVATVRAVGAVAVLAWVSPTIEAYFAWQGLVSLCSLITLAVATYWFLPTPPLSPRFTRQAVVDVWRFASGMMTTAFLVFLLVQLDKILLSRLLSLESFGYYALASTVAMVISLLVSPASQAFYPRFSEIVARGDTAKLVSTYHQGAQLVAVLAAPVAMTLIFFSEQIMFLWSGNGVLTHEVAPLLALLSVGSLLNGLMTMPYMLSLAYGWSGFAVRVNAVAVTVLVPAIVWATHNYGAMGAAWTWALLNVGYLLLGIRYLHSRLLPQEISSWYWCDVARPLIAATGITALCSTLLLHVNSRFGEVILIVSSGIGSVFVAAMFSTAIREKALDVFLDRRPS